MTLEKVACWDILCDGCGISLIEGEYGCVTDPEVWLDESDWLTTEDGKHLCSRCQPIEEDDDD